MNEIRNYVYTAKLIQKITSYTDTVKSADLEKHMRKILKEEEGQALVVSTEKIMRSLYEYNNPQKTAELLKVIKQYPKAYKTILNTVFEYSKNGEEVFKELTPNMTEEQEFDYNLKKTENYLLDSDLEDKEIIDKLLSILSFTKTTISLEQINLIQNITPRINSDNLSQTFIIEKHQDQYILFPLDNTDNDIAVVLDPKLMNRNSVAKAAEMAMKSQLKSKENLEVNSCSDSQIRKILQAYIYIAIKYQGDVREKELEKYINTEEKKPSETYKNYNKYQKETEQKENILNKEIDLPNKEREKEEDELRI